MKNVTQFVVYAIVILFCAGSLVKGNLVLFEYLSFGLIFYLVMAIVLVWMGVSQLLSKTPVGGGIMEKAPLPKEISDCKAWNQKHGIFWITYGIVTIGTFAMLTLCKNHMVASVTHALVVSFGIGVYLIYDEWLKKKYFLKKK